VSSAPPKGLPVGEQATKSSQPERPPHRGRAVLLRKLSIYLLDAALASSFLPGGAQPRPLRFFPNKLLLHSRQDLFVNDRYVRLQ
jgi:hypothetical protein